MATAPVSVPEKLDVLAIARAEGDISGMLKPSMLATIGRDVVQDYETDCADRHDWAERAKRALDSAAQNVESGPVEFPFEGASDVHYPILTVAALQFHARAYPAFVRGDEVVNVKTIGKDRDGAKAARATRVRDYLNTTIMYRMQDWESDTDAMLLQLPIVGCAFRKQWWDKNRARPASAFVPALRLIVPSTAKSLDVAPRLTEELAPIYPYELRRNMRSGFYRDVVLPPSASSTNDAEAPRDALEQHRLMDLDEDGIDEPYIVTVDKESCEVLRIEPAFDEQDFELNAKGELFGIRRRCAYRYYQFFPDPKGGFYALGFGHLLHQIAAVIDTSINQMMDAGQAAVAGGGFIAAGVRMQGAGQSSWMEWRPGEYKVVDAPAGVLRDAVWERTFPQASPIMLQLLELMLGAANDIAAIKDVTSGDASNNGQVGTTLALIEQGLQVFTAIYKRVFRAAKDEFQRYFDDIGDYGDERTAQDYLNVLDDEAADFSADFDGDDMDIRPISDPGSVTRMQKMAKAQFLFGLRGSGLNDMEIMKRVLEAADTEDIDALMPQPAEPDPMMVAALAKTESEAARNNAQAAKAEADAVAVVAEMGMTIGEADAYATGEGTAPGIAAGGGIGGGVSGVAGPSGDALDVGGVPALGGDAAGGMGAPELAVGAG